jgi:hypothetical protein
MSASPASASSAEDRHRPAPERLLVAWVAEQTETLDPKERAALDAAQPDWRGIAAQRIAEGLLAYVVLEMVAPDLAIAGASGGALHANDDALNERLVAHIQDFVDYRDELAERGGPTLGSSANSPDHSH